MKITPKMNILQCFLSLAAVLSPLVAQASLDGLSAIATDLILLLTLSIVVLVIVFGSLFKFIKFLLKSSSAQRLKTIAFLLVAFLFWYLTTGFLYFILLFLFSHGSWMEIWKIPLAVVKSLFEFPWPRVGISIFLAMITSLLSARLYRSTKI